MDRYCQINSVDFTDERVLIVLKKKLSELGELSLLIPLPPPHASQMCFFICLYEDLFIGKKKRKTDPSTVCSPMATVARGRPSQS